MLRKIRFRVVHVTSQEDKYPAKELNQPSPITKGWRSSRHCIFPQQIVIELEKPSRLKKIQILSHQCLIASKVEFYIGDSCGDDTINMETSRFLRLGHIELSNNECNNFRARELKSVHVDAMGSCLQLFLYKNFPNSENVYDQISIIALNFIGDISELPNAIGKDTNSKINLEYVSPIDDLAFDVYQDPRLMDLLRRLQCQKVEYARRENFEMARRARDAILYIQEVGERLWRLEVEKQEAVRTEDYEEAKAKKDQITQLREGMSRDIDLRSLLANETDTVVSAYKEARLEAAHPFLPPSQAMLNVKPARHWQESPTPSESIMINSYEEEGGGGGCDKFDRYEAVEQQWMQSSNLADERPLPALVAARQQQVNNNNSSNNNNNYQNDDFATASSYTDTSRSPMDHREEDSAPLETLSEASIRQAAVAIDVVGQPLVTKAYSKSWQLREEALRDLENRVSNASLSPPASLATVPDAEPDPLAELRSTTFLLSRALNDQVMTVYSLALTLIHPMIVEFGERHNLPRQEIVSSLDTLVPYLLQKTGDGAARVRDVTKAQVIEMAQWPIIRHGNAFWHALLRPFQPTMLERLALSRVEIASELYADLGLSSSHSHGHIGASSVMSAHSQGFTAEDLILFTVHALEHRSSEIRDAAEALIMALYRNENRDLVRQLMPPNDIEAQRQPRLRRIFAKFAKVDGRPMIDTTQAPTVTKTATTSSQQSNLKPSAPIANRQVKKTANLVGGLGQLGNGAARSSVGQKASSPTKRPPIGASEQLWQQGCETADIDLLLSLDKTCIFCGEQDDNFTEEALDMHYWKTCPMLRRCPNCKQVVEISSLIDHLLSECDAARANGGYSRCTRCGEAVPNAAYKDHVRIAACKPTRDPAHRCPLCHVDLPVPATTAASSGSPPGNAAEEVWKQHLMGTVKEGGGPIICTQNNRQPKIVSSILGGVLQRPSKVISKSANNQWSKRGMMDSGKKVHLNRVNVS